MAKELRMQQFTRCDDAVLSEKMNHPNAELNGSTNKKYKRYGVQSVDYHHSYRLYVLLLCCELVYFGGESEFVFFLIQTEAAVWMVHLNSKFTIHNGCLVFVDYPRSHILWNIFLLRPIIPTFSIFLLSYKHPYIFWW